MNILLYSSNNCISFLFFKIEVSSIYFQLIGCTTPMYRTPEMIDTWNNYEIGKAVDVWALGCILYTLCYKKHPFEDSAKLAILNANFSIPQNNLKFKDFHPIISTHLL